ncbi:MAG: hypothetical protein LBB18_04200, partial [Puniceicoccales bacterium]|nr:hypothetical protein [Puniceicoccales bacterium]
MENSINLGGNANIGMVIGINDIDPKEETGDVSDSGAINSQNGGAVPPELENNFPVGAATFNVANGSSGTMQIQSQQSGAVTPALPVLENMSTLLHPPVGCLHSNDSEVPNNSANKKECKTALERAQISDQTKMNCHRIRDIAKRLNFAKCQKSFTSEVSEEIPEADQLLMAIKAIASSEDVKMYAKVSKECLIYLARSAKGTTDVKYDTLKALCKCKNLFSSDKISLLHAISSFFWSTDQEKFPDKKNKCLEVMKEFITYQFPVYVYDLWQTSLDNPTNLPIMVSLFLENYVNASAVEALKIIDTCKIVEIPEENLSKFLNSMENDDARVNALREVATSSSNISAMFGVIFVAVDGINCDKCKALVLEAIAKNVHLTNENDITKLFNSISRIKKESSRICTLIALAYQVSAHDDNFYRKLLDATSKIEDENLRVSVLKAIIDEKLVLVKHGAEFVKLASDIQDEHSRALMLEALAESVDFLLKSNHGNLLKTTNSIGNEMLLASILGTISKKISCLDASQCETMFKLIEKIKNEDALTVVLCSIASKIRGLDDEFCVKLFNFIGKITNEKFLSSILKSAMFDPFIPYCKWNEKLFEFIGDIKNETDRCNVLDSAAVVFFGRHVDDSKKNNRDMLLNLIAKITDEKLRAGVLISIASMGASLDKNDRTKLFDTMVKIKDNELHADVLTHIAGMIKYLDKDIRARLFNLTEKIENEGIRSNVLSRIANEMSNLNEGEREVLFKLTEAINGEEIRVNVLESISVKMHCIGRPGREALLRLTEKITDENLRTRVVCGIVREIDFFDKEKRKTLFKLTEGIVEDRSRAGVLRLIAGCINRSYGLDEDECKELFKLTKGITAESDRASVLKSIADRINEVKGNDCVQLFALIEEITDEKLRVGVLDRIAKEVDMYSFEDCDCLSFLDLVNCIKCAESKMNVLKTFVSAGGVLGWGCRDYVINILIDAIKDFTENENARKEMILSITEKWYCRDVMEFSFLSTFVNVANYELFTNNMGNDAEFDINWNLVSLSQGSLYMKEDERDELLKLLKNVPDEIKCRSLAYIYKSLFVLNTSQLETFFEIFRSIDVNLRSEVMYIADYDSYGYTRSVISGNEAKFNTLSHDVIGRILTSIGEFRTSDSKQKALMFLLSRLTCVDRKERKIALSIVDTLNAGVRDGIKLLFKKIFRVSPHEHVKYMMERYENLPNEERNENLSEAVDRLCKIAETSMKNVVNNYQSIGKSVESAIERFDNSISSIFEALACRDKFPSREEIDDIYSAIFGANAYTNECVDSLSTAAGHLEIRLELLKVSDGVHSTIGDKIRLMYTVWVNSAIDAVFASLSTCFKDVEEPIEGALLMKKLHKILSANRKDKTVTGASGMTFVSAAVTAIEKYASYLGSLTNKTLPVFAPYNSMNEISSKYSELQPFTELQSAMNKNQITINGTKIEYKAILPILLLIYNHLERNPMSMDSGHYETIVGKVQDIPMAYFPNAWVGYEGDDRNFSKDFAKMLMEVK